MRLLILLFPKISRYVKTFQVKDRDRDKNNKLMSCFGIDDEILLEKYKAIWTKNEDLRNNWIKCFTSLWWWIYKNQYKNKWW